MPHSLALTPPQHTTLRTHLFPGDGLETAAILLCHHGKGKTGFRLIVAELILIPRSVCKVRTPSRLTWPFADHLPPEKITAIDKAGLSILTIHNHPSGIDRFSITDNRNDQQLFASVNNWFDDNRPNGSAIMLPDGKIISRLVDTKGKFTPIESTAVVGEDIRIWKQHRPSKTTPGYALRIAQTFGKGTFTLLRQLRVGVVGCSGTGSIVIELLARNCIGHLVIVDPDCVEEKNLNRIINAMHSDARKGTPKVEATQRAIKRMGMQVQVDAYQVHTTDRDVIEALTDCDVLFGCVDSAEGRYHLECIASAYRIPYFDTGVNLETDHHGTILQADAVSHYMHPGNASLLSRRGYTTEQVTAEGWHRTNPKHYEVQRVAGYLAEVNEDQPAVMSINMQAACMAFNDFLARLHHFRLDSNDDFANQRFRLVHGSYEYQTEQCDTDSIFQKYAGMGERSFLLQRLKNP